MGTDTALEISQMNVRMDNFDAKTGEIRREQRDCFNKIQEDFVDIKPNVAKLDHVAGQECEKMTIVEARMEQMSHISQQQNVRIGNVEAKIENSDVIIENKIKVLNR